MSQLDEIAEREARLKEQPEWGVPTSILEADLSWLLNNTRAALAYIAERLPTANSELHMHLTRLQNILTGLDDGLPASETGEPK